MRQLVSRTLFLALIISTVSIAEAYLAKETLRLSKIHDHPELKKGDPRGYVEFWVATSFGMWMRDLEEGPTTCDGWDIVPLQNGKNATPYPNVDDVPIRIGTMKQLTWPEGISMKYRPIADNFSGIRIPMPVGEQNVMILYDKVNCPLPTKVAARVKAGEPGWKTYLVGVLPIEENRVTVGLDIRNEGDRLGVYAWLAPATLPVANAPMSFNPDLNVYSEYLKYLKSPDWGFRWYAARRLGMIHNKSAIPILKTMLDTEEHKDVRNEIEKAIKKLE